MNRQNHRHPTSCHLSYDCRGQRIATRRWGTGPKHAVLLHGFPDDADSMALVGLSLANHGYTVWAPFLRGYAPSEKAHDGRYDITELAQDIYTFLSKIEARACVLVGHDWGAVLAYAVSALNHEGISRVVGLSVPPIPSFIRAFRRPNAQFRLSQYMLFFQLSGYAEARLKKDNFQGIESLWQQWSPGWTIPKDRLNGVKRTFSMPGTLEAALSYYGAARPGVSRRRRNNWRLMNTKPAHPVICLVGQDDHCISPQAFRFVGFPVHIVPGAGHFLPLEAPDVVVQHVLTP
jgi:pimeloyl-ACP methyl ester carboxylesterase